MIAIENRFSALEASLAKVVSLLELSQGESKDEKRGTDDKLDLVEKLLAEMKGSKPGGSSSSSSSSSVSDKSREAKERAALSLKKMEDLADDHKDLDYKLLEDTLPGDDDDHVSSDDERDGHSRVVDGTEPMAPVVHAAVTKKFGSWRKLVEKMRSIKSTHYKHELERLAGIIDALDEDENVSVKSGVFERAVRSFIAVQAMCNGNHPDFILPLFTSLDGERSTDVLTYVPGWGSFLRSQLMLTLKLKKLNQEVTKNAKSGDSDNGGSEWFGKDKKKKPNRRPKKGKRPSDDSSSSGSGGKSDSKRGGEAKGKSSAAQKP
jgi:hypothetical protein